MSTVQEARGENYNTTNIVPHHIHLTTATISIERAVGDTASTAAMQRDNIILCDNKHYGVVFMVGNDWHLFDSLGIYKVFEREVWPTIQKMSPLFEHPRDTKEIPGGGSLKVHEGLRRGHIMTCGGCR